MAINTNTFESTLQNKLDNVTDPKEMLLIGKALESTVGSIAVSDIQDEGTTQVNAVNTAGTTKVGEVNSAGSTQVTAVNNAGTTEVANVQGVLGNYTPTSGFKTVGGTSIVGSGDIATLPSGGSAGQVLKKDGSNNPAWDEDEGGAILQVKQSTYTGNASFGETWVTHLGTSITPKKPNSSFYFQFQGWFGYENHDRYVEIAFDVSGAAPGGIITPVGTDTGHAVFAHSGIGSTAGASTVDDWTIATTPAHFLWTPSSNLGTGTRNFQVLTRSRGTGGSGVRWNARWGQGNDVRNVNPVGVLTVFEIAAEAV